MAEEFAFEKGGSERRTVDLDQQGLPPGAQVVKLACDVVFAGTRFSGDQDRYI
jgi:hypothetical protein